MNEFLDSIGRNSSIYGLHKDTVSSILLTMMPPIEHDYSHYVKLPKKSTPAYEVRNFIMEMTLEALKKNAGFLIPQVSKHTVYNCDDWEEKVYFEEEKNFFTIQIFFCIL